jgi:hypothetical protein
MGRVGLPPYLFNRLGQQVQEGPTEQSPHSKRTQVVHNPIQVCQVREHNHLQVVGCGVECVKGSTQDTP